MSLLDQVIAYGGAKLTAEDVARVLGVADRAILHELASALVAGDAAAALKVVDRIAQQGFDLVHVAKDVLSHLRNLVVAKVCGEGADRELLDLADEEVADVRALAAKADADDLQRLFQGFSRSFDEIARSGQPKTGLEMTLVRLARRPALLPLDELLVRLGDLEKRLATGAPPPSPPPTRGGGPGDPSSRGRSSSMSAPDRGGAGVLAPAAPRWEAGEQSEGTAPRGLHPAERTRGSLALAEPETRGAPSAPPQAFAPPAPRPVVEPAPAAIPAPPPPPPPRIERPANLDDWRAILARVRATMPAAAAIFEHGVPLEVTAARVLVGYQSDSFEGARASEPEGFDLLQREARAHFNAETKVALDLSARPGVTVAAIDAADRKEQLLKARSAASAHPMVQKAIALFRAELRDVRLPGGDD